MEQPSLEKQIATPAATRLYYLERSKRAFAPLRRDFVQAPRSAASRPGPLAEFVRNGDLRGLRAYLFIVAITSSELEQEGWSWTLHSRIWARAFGTTENAMAPSAQAAVMKTLHRLEERRLITVHREGRSREIRVTLLREDGTGSPYTRPGAGNTDPYLKLPFSYWRSDLDSELKMPGLAMLLVASCERRRFRLPTARVNEWYGWSADTAERGFRELADHNVLDIAKRYEPAPASPSGTTEVNEYTLRRPYRHRPGQPLTPSPVEATVAAILAAETLEEVFAAQHGAHRS
jgi:hypothetical protein